MAFGWDDAAKIAAPVLGLATGIGAGKRQIKQQVRFIRIMKKVRGWNLTTI